MDLFDQSTISDQFSFPLFVKGTLWCCEYCTHSKACGACLSRLHSHNSSCLFLREQCEDRIYRIGQKKDCDIRYYDVPLTIDDIMGKNDFDFARES